MTLSDATRRVLEERASRLAQPIAAEAEGTTFEAIVLPLGGERYGLEIRYVLEVVRDPAVFAVPQAPDIVAGVVNWRGTVLPVFDLCRLFDRPRVAFGPDAAIAVVGGETAEFGILSEPGIERISIPLAEIRADAPFAGRSDQDFIKGVTARAIIVLDAERLLADRRLFVGVTNDESRDDRGG